VKVLNVPPIYVIIDGEYAGQLAQKFEKGELYVIDADGFHVQTLIALERTLQSMP
jgi:hypothetical protein